MGHFTAHIGAWLLFRDECSSTHLHRPPPLAAPLVGESFEFAVNVLHALIQGPRAEVKFGHSLSELLGEAPRVGRVPKTRDPAYSWPMRDTPEFLVQHATVDEADRALWLGFAIETTLHVAAECGAPEPGQADPGDSLEDVLEAHLHPYGSDGEEPL